MKLKHLIIAAVLMVALGTQSSFAAKGQIEIAPHANIALPMGDFGDFYNLGFGAGSTFDYFVSDMFAIGGRFSWTTFGADDYTITIPGVGTQTYSVDGLSMIELSGHGRYFLGQDAAKALFLEGILGLFMYGGSGDGSDIGFGGGVGKRFPLGQSGKTVLVPEVLFYLIPGDVSDATMIVARVGFAFGVGGQK